MVAQHLSSNSELLPRVGGEEAEWGQHWSGVKVTVLCMGRRRSLGDKWLGRGGLVRIASLERRRDQMSQLDCFSPPFQDI